MGICFSLIGVGCFLLLVAVCGRFVGLPLIRPRIRIRVRLRRRRLLIPTGTMLRMVCSGAACTLLGAMSLTEVAPLSQAPLAKEPVVAEVDSTALCAESGVNLFNTQYVPGEMVVRATLFAPPMPVSTMGYSSAFDLSKLRFYEELADRNGRAVVISHGRY